MVGTSLRECLRVCGMLLLFGLACTQRSSAVVCEPYVPLKISTVVIDGQAIDPSSWPNRFGNGTFFLSYDQGTRCLGTHLGKDGDWTLYAEDVEEEGR